LLAYVYGSILAAVVAPDWAMLGGYTSYLPNVDFRLFGVTPHSNSLGPLAAAYVVLEMASPTHSRARILHLLATVGVLLFAQSKTAWVFILSVGVIYVLQKARQWFFGAAAGYGTVTIFTLTVLASAIVMWLLMVATGSFELRMYESGGEIETLTGRIYIWAITLNVWQDNPLFGYGLGLWDEDFRAHYGLLFAGHAHNQFVQVLGSSGIVGLAGLLIYLGTLFVNVIRIAGNNVVPALLFGLIAIDCFTEAPLRNYHIFDAFFLIHLFLFAQLAQVTKHGMQGSQPALVANRLR